MKKSLFAKLAVLGAVVVLFTSCAKVPQVDIDNAKAAIEAAKAAEANRYVPADFNKAQDTLNAALAAVENQKSKFALFRSYKESKKLLVSTVNLANKAKENAAIRKEQVKQEVMQSLTDAQTLVTEIKELITKAPKGKEGKAALEAIQADLALVEASLTEVTTLANNGDYLTAQDKVNAAKVKATSLKTELEGAIAKTKAAKGGHKK
jgi:hypothetical protein